MPTTAYRATLDAYGGSPARSWCSGRNGWRDGIAEEVRSSGPASTQSSSAIRFQTSEALMKPIVAYIRVSTSQQGRSGLGMRRQAEHAADGVGARASAAMLHAGRHEQPVERPEVLNAAHRVCDRLEVVDRALRRDRRVVPAVILDELAAGRLEGGEIRVRRVERRGDRRDGPSSASALTRAVALRAPARPM